MPTKNFTLITKKLNAPENLTASESLIVINNKAVARLSISYAAVKGAIGYYLQYKFDNGNFINQQVKGTNFDIDNITKGKFVIRVFSINALNKRSERPNEIEFTSVGKTALPGDVQNLRVETISDQLMRLRFDKSTDIDVLHGGNVVVRHSNLTDGNGTFTNSVDLIPALPGSVSETMLPAIDGEYILKFRDDGNRLSSGEASVIVVNPDPLPKLLVFDDREDTDSPAFGGTKVDCFFSSELNGLVLGSDTKLDNITDFDAVLNFDFLDGANTTDGGTYNFVSILDLGAVHPLRLTRHLITQGFYPNDLIDSRTANIDTWTDFDAATAFDVNAKLTVAVTSAAPSNGSSYQDSDFTGKTFNTFANGTFVGRGFKFRCEMISFDPAQSIEIDQLGYSAELDRRVETVNSVIASTTSTKSVTFANSFFTGASGTDVSANSAKPTVGITIDNMTAGDEFFLSNISGTGFDIDIKNNGSNVDRNFKYTAIGFGRGS